jgi:hypothetical protein
VEEVEEEGSMMIPDFVVVVVVVKDAEDVPEFTAEAASS